MNISRREVETITKRAKEIHIRKEQERKNDYFKRSIGLLINKKLLFSNNLKVSWDQPVPIKDLLKASKIEYRVLEVLPALLYLFPSCVEGDIPEDYQETLRKIENREEDLPLLRDIELKKYMRHLRTRERLLS